MRHTHHLARDDWATFSFRGIVRPPVNHPVLLPTVMNTFSLCVYSEYKEKAFEWTKVITDSRGEALRSKRLCVYSYVWALLNSCLLYTSDAADEVCRV